MGISRNALCPCGSGRKYKRCCLAAAQEIQRAERFEEEVGERIQAWATRTLAAELASALAQFVGAPTDQGGHDRVLSDTDVELFSAWFHYDRPLPDGATPAERYAHRPELGAKEREAAAKIASARLGLHRVVEVRDGEWILLENLVSGDRVQVASANVSREATRWDLLIGRLMAGDRPGLWGPVRLLEPSDEPDLLAELARLGGGVSSEPDIAGVLERHPLDVARFRPPSWDIPPTFYTLEGDLVAEASAAWRTPDPRALEQRVREIGRLGPAEESVIDITVPRDVLVRERGELPPGALVFETASDVSLDAVPIATLRVEGGRLKLEAMSEKRLQRAVEIVNGDFGDLIESLELDVIPIERGLPEQGAARPGDLTTTATGLSDGTERQLLEDFMTDRMRRWVDDPHPKLNGLTPRQAARGAGRGEVIRLVRSIENGVERARHRGEPGADVRWLRSELGVEDQLAA